MTRRTPKVGFEDPKGKRAAGPGRRYLKIRNTDAMTES